MLDLTGHQTPGLEPARLSYRLGQLQQQGLRLEGRCGVISDMGNQARDKRQGHITVLETHPGECAGISEALFGGC